MDLVQAAEIARQYLESIGSVAERRLELVNAQLHENGWLFHFQSGRFLATREWLYALGGNHPFLVDNSGSVEQFGLDDDIEAVAGSPLWGGASPTAG